MSGHAAPRRIGIIAGRGEITSIAARRLRRDGWKVTAVGFDRETETALSGVADAYHSVRMGQLGRLIEVLKGDGVSSVLMLGKVHKTAMFRRSWPDARALKLWRALLDRRDDSILLAFVGELEKDGIAVERADRFLGSLFAASGTIAGRAPGKKARADVAFGWRLAKEIGRLDLGQTVVVKDRAPVAVEAIEGTDETILRGGALAGPGTVVVKVAKPQQDLRFDVPVVGLETARSLVKARAAVLAVEAGMTLFVQREETLALLRKHRVAVLGCRDADFS